MSSKTDADPDTPAADKTALIIGAGPAGLTAALEFLKQSSIKPVVLEASREIGGLSRTVRYKGNRMDIGGHRFFSKSDRVMEWWLEQMPTEAGADNAACHQLSKSVAHDRGHGRAGQRHGCGAGPGDAGASAQEPHLFSAALFRLPDHADQRYAEQAGNDAHRQGGLQLPGLARCRRSSRRSRWKIFSSTGSAGSSTSTSSRATRRRFGAWPAMRYLRSGARNASRGCRLSPRPSTFLKKSWGRREQGIAQKGTDTSLIERFLYPKFGPGQLWEHVAEKVVDGGRRDSSRVEGGAG